MPVSESLGTEVNQMVVAKPFTAIANVVDTSYFCRVPIFKNPIFQFIHISDMSENKNVFGILNAVALLNQIRKDFRVLFVGKKNEMILKHAEHLNVKDQCDFIGEISYFEVAEYVKKSHVGILFSKSESQSCVVLEWLCSGLPVISSRVGGVVELIQKSNGILVDSNDENELYCAMNELMNNYSKYDLNQISEDAINKYSYQAVARQIMSVYQSIAENRKEL
ncbi:MAG: group 1 glycosyl transferase [Bacteroidetes bacterium OLB11]|nr:MAG: group 1 glycosyl transferase [Bacteroidetes bacterium OLB11]